MATTTANTTEPEWIDPLFPGLAPGEKLLATAALIGLLVGGMWFARALRRRIDAEGRVRQIHALFTLGAGVFGVVVVTLIMSVWAEELRDVSAFSFLGFDDPVGVVTQVAVTVLLFVGVYVLGGFIEEFIHDLTEDATALTRHQSELVFRSIQVALYVFTGLIALSIWNVNIGGLLLGAGFLGIVIGLAAQQTLGSLIAGFVLMIARPFEIGDWVRISEREGIVTEISIVNTRIQTFDGEYVEVPNDVVGSSEIVNRTRKGRLRIRLEVGVDYDTDLDLAVDTATGAMRDVNEILSVPQPQVVMKEFGNSAIVLELRFWIDKPSSRRRWRAQTAVIGAVKTAFDREGITIPFPQRELSDRPDDRGVRPADETAVTGAPPDPGETDE
ncbi:MAG: mechanosensitive ion channel family protein [Halobacteriales archaeon]